MLLAILAQLIYALIFPIGLQWIFDRAVAMQDLFLLMNILIILFVGFIISTFAGIVQDHIASRVGAMSLTRLREKMFKHLQSLSAHYYNNVQKGDLISRFSNDLLVIENAMTRGIPLGISRLLLIIASVVLLFFLEWRLALTTLVFSPILFIGPDLLNKRVVAASYDRKQQDAGVTDILQETISGHTVVRAFGLENVLLERVKTRDATWIKSTVNMNFLTFLIGRITNFSILFLILLIVGIGAYFTIQGTLSVGVLVAFVALLLNVDEGVRGMNEVWPHLLQSIGGMRRVSEFFAEKPHITDTADANPFVKLPGKITFQDVSFSYGTEVQNLNKVTFTIYAGQSVAFVGTSGSGKSTVLSLLTRSYDPQEGRLFFGNVELKQITRDSVRSQLGMVFQDTFLFNTSVRENIRLGKLNATDDEVEIAAKAAELHKLVLGLPSGYDTTVGDSGGNLSGGQRQRIAIARAIVRNPSVLILDEATSALDPGTEAAINKTIGKLAEDRTVVTVTHRLASVVNMDCIFVMDNGALVEEGTHEELLSLEGKYHELWKKQSGFTITSDGNHAKVDSKRLKSIPLLAKLNDDYLETIAHQFITEQFSPGHDIIQQSEPAKKFYLIVRGAVEVLATTPAGAFQQLAILEIGDYFGEIGLLADMPTTATVRTRMRTICLSLNKEQFRNLLEENPELQKVVRPVMESRRREVEASMKSKITD